MKRRVYPKYKDSNIEWLGEIPEHWEACRTDIKMPMLREPISPEQLRGKKVFHYSIPSVQETNTGTRDDGEFIDSSKTKITCQVLLVSKLNPRKATIVLATPHPNMLTVCSGEFIPLVPLRCHAKYAEYLYRSEMVRQELDARVESATRSHQRVNPNDIRKLYLTWPPLPEQRAIAAFLDRETARIDELIKKKERQIELLQEKRAAVISHAVTKGLNPNVKMKPSCIEWLGEIPEHWEVKRLKHVVKCLDGHRIPLNAEQRGRMQGEYPYWGANGVVDYLNDWLFDENLVLLGEDGAPFFERFKDVAFFVSGKVWVNNHIHVLRPLSDTEPRYLVHILNITDYGAFIDGTTRDKLTQDKMNNIPVVFPPTSEQRAIAAFLDRETARIDALIEKIRKSIDLLREYRTALISACVTGKIDVQAEVA